MRRRALPSDEHLVTIVGQIGIVVLVAVGLIIMAVVPDTSNGVIPVVSVGVASLSALSRRQPATNSEMVAAAKQGSDESSAQLTQHAAPIYAEDDQTINIAAPVDIKVTNTPLE